MKRATFLAILIAPQLHSQYGKTRI